MSIIVVYLILLIYMRWRFGNVNIRLSSDRFLMCCLQDLAVVVLLILIPLLSPNSSKGGVSFSVMASYAIL
jgi:hypothetical protein